MEVHSHSADVPNCVRPFLRVSVQFGFSGYVLNRWTL
jgi:hypothetical protein